MSIIAVFSKNCKIKAIPEYKIEQAILQNLNEISISSEAMTEIIANIKDCVASEMHYNSNLAEDNYQKIKKINKKIEQLYNDKLENLITIDFFQKQYEKWNEEIEVLQKQSDECKRTHEMISCNT